MVRTAASDAAVDADGRYPYHVQMEIEWDAAKAATDPEKHAVSFEEVATSALDPMALTPVDDAAAAGSRLSLITQGVTLRRDSIDPL